MQLHVMLDLQVAYLDNAYAVSAVKALSNSHLLLTAPQR